MSGPVFAGDSGLDARIDEALARPQLAATLEAARRTVRDSQVSVRARYPDWPERVARARQIRLAAIGRMDELLDRFEGRLRANGGTLVRARTAEEATSAVLAIARRRGATLVAKGKSMVSEEIGLNEALEHAGVRAIETDLGEWVCQLAGQRPSHLLAPIVHMDRHEVADVLSAEAGELIGDDPATMVAWAARACGGRSSTRASASRAPTSGRRDGIESCSRTRATAVWSPRSRAVTCRGRDREARRAAAERRSWSSSSRSPRSAASCPTTSRGSPGRPGDERRRPGGVVVVVVDAGRRALVGTPYEEALVHPLRSLPERVPGLREGRRPRLRLGVLGPDRRGAHAAARGDAAGRGPAAAPLSSLCGACTEACPVGIPLHDLLVRDRAAAVQAGEASLSERAAWRAWSLAWSSPRRYRASARGASLGRSLARVLPAAAAWRSSHATLPQVDSRPFHARWDEIEREAP